MNTQEKLQRAVSITIKSGHQLNRDAFEFLQKKAHIKDPVVIINQVLKEITELENKPLFIDKSLLEKLFEKIKKESTSELANKLKKTIVFPEDEKDLSMF